jgi:hypothetical protein
MQVSFSSIYRYLTTKILTLRQKAPRTVSSNEVNCESQGDHVYYSDPDNTSTLIMSKTKRVWEGPEYRKKWKEDRLKKRKEEQRKKRSLTESPTPSKNEDVPKKKKRTHSDVSVSLQSDRTPQDSHHSSPDTRKYIPNFLLLVFRPLNHNINNADANL